jgi:hypothetical protein
MTCIDSVIMVLYSAILISKNDSELLKIYSLSLFAYLCFRCALAFWSSFCGCSLVICITCFHQLLLCVSVLTLLSFAASLLPFDVSTIRCCFICLSKSLATCWTNSLSCFFFLASRATFCCIATCFSLIPSLCLILPIRSLLHDFGRWRTQERTVLSL